MNVRIDYTLGERAKTTSLHHLIIEIMNNLLFGSLASGDYSYRFENWANYFSTLLLTIEKSYICVCKLSAWKSLKFHGRWLQKYKNKTKDKHCSNSSQLTVDSWQLTKRIAIKRF